MKYYPMILLLIVLGLSACEADSTSSGKVESANTSSSTQQSQGGSASKLEDAGP